MKKKLMIVLVSTFILVFMASIVNADDYNTVISIPFEDVKFDSASPLTFGYDMDCDGIDNTITIYEEHVETRYFKLHISIDGCEYISDKTPVTVRGIYLMDLNIDDNTKEILIGEGYHSHSWYSIVRFENGIISFLQIENDGVFGETTKTRAYIEDKMLGEVVASGNGYLTISGNVDETYENQQYVVDKYKEIKKGYLIDSNSEITEQEEQVSVYINGDELEFDQPPVIIDGRTLVPLRAIFEALGATVEWSDENKTVTAAKGNTSVKIAIGDNKLYVNDDIVELDVPAQIINERTLIPVRAISEAFGSTVEWDGDSRTVNIEYNDSGNDATIDYTK